MIYSQHIHWLVIVCLALWTLIVILYALLLALYAWPTLQRVRRIAWTTLYQHLHCLWCWRALHLLRWYPRRWPSNLCSQHRRQARAQMAARQARYVRYHIETTPAVPALHTNAGGPMIITYQPPMTPARIPPVVAPIEACCYCWYVLHPTRPYPPEWSSTICAEHSVWVLSQHAAIRAARRALPNRKQLEEVLA